MESAQHGGVWFYAVFIVVVAPTTRPPATALPILYAIIGGKVDLQCDLNSTFVDNDISLILWYTGESSSPIYSIDARELPLYEAKHFPSKGYGARTYYNATISPSVLTIKHLKKEDEGIYRCRIEYKRARTQTQECLLKIIVPPREAIIMDEFGQRLHGIIGPYNEGYPMTLVCEGEGGDPPPKVTWWKDSVLVDETYTLTPQHFSRNELHFSSIRREDLLTVLSCQAANSNLSVPATSLVVLDLNLRPLDVKIHTPRRPLRIGEEVQLVCQSQGARPPAQITWWKQSEKLVQATETMFRENNLTISVLTYVPSVNDNGINISCHADNPQVRDSEIYDHWYLDVYYSPQVTLSNAAEVPVEGSNISLICHISANPQEIAVTWIYNGEMLLSNPSAGIIMKNRTLLLSPVKKRHQGFYQCEAVNSEGTGRSQELLLTIYYAPECITPNEIIYGILRTKPSTVICEVDANPAEVTFKWALNRSAQEISPLDSFKSNGTRSIATILPGSDLNYGTLLCWASNSVALQKEPCIFHLLPAGPPEPPTRCVTTDTSECVMVQCKPGNDGGLTQYFHLEMSSTESGRLQTNLSVSDVPAFNICSLPAEMSYTFLIYSVNAKGRSKSVALRSNILSSRNIREEDAQLINHVAGILIGIAIVLIILCAAIIAGKFRSCTHRNGRKFRQDVEKSPAHILVTDDDTRLSRCQGPDIIPEKKYFQKSLEKAMADSISYPMVDTKDTTYKSSPRKYSKYKTTKYSMESDMVLTECLHSPRKLNTLSETDGEVEDSNITVETPLINDIQLTAAHWGETHKETGVLSTPV